MDLPGRLLVQKLDIDADHFMLGFTTKETGNMVGKAQGFHSPNILVIASEAQAISDSIYEQFDGVLTSENSLLIMIGNPLCTTGKFAREIKKTQKNIVICLDCLNSPNYQHQKTMIEGMASHIWIEKKRQEWNADGSEKHPLWLGRVRGRVPTSSIDSVFSTDLLDSILGIEPRVLKRRKAAGVDPARYGDDEFVIYAGTSGKVEHSLFKAMCDGPEAVSYIRQVTKALNGPCCVAIEEDGLGGPICDFHRKLKDDCVKQEDVLLSRANEKAGGKKKFRIVPKEFFNMRAWLWWEARQMAMNREVALPPEDIYLYEELAEVKYFYNAKGQIQLESKDDVKERLGRSPNRADAWVLYCWGLKHAPVVYKDAYRDSGSSGEVMSAVTSAMTA